MWLLLGATACGGTDPATPMCVKDTDCGVGVCVDGVCRSSEPTDAGTPSTEDAGVPGRGVRLDAPLFSIYPRDAVAMAGGDVLFVGTTSRGFEVGEDREAYVLRYRPDGSVRFGKRIGDTGNDQFFTVVAHGDTAVAGGYTRSFHFEGVRNTDLLIGQVTRSGSISVSHWGTAGDEYTRDLAEGGAVAPFVGVGIAEEDGLVVALDAESKPIWAYTVDAGQIEALHDVLVMGTTIIAVGERTSADALTSEGLVVAMTESQVLFARTFPSRGGASRIIAEPESRTVLVIGAADHRGTPSPAVYRFDANGEPIAAFRYELGTAAYFTTGLPVGGAYLLGGTLLDVPFLGRLTAELTLMDVARFDSSFLADAHGIPLVPGPSPVALFRTSGNVIGAEVGTDASAICRESSLLATPVELAPATAIEVQMADLELVGGTVANARILDFELNVANAEACQPSE